MILVDTGPLVAAANRNDTHHRASTEALAATRPPRLVPGMVIAEVEYADLPLGATDACIVALAERLNVTELVTLDQRHFNIVRPRHVNTLTLIP
jgi:predicted nucleic acid-binding protein